MRPSVVLCAIALFALPAGAEAPAWLKKVTVQTEHTVAYRDYTLLQGGTGTIVASDEGGFDVLTCRHNFETREDKKVGAGTIKVTCDGGKSYPASLIRHDAGVDLALLRVKTRDRRKAAGVAAKGEAQAGLKVVKFGFPGWVPKYGEGEVAAYSATQNGRRVTPLLLGVAQGDSGCGAFRAGDRLLIGVISSGTGRDASAVSLSDVREFLGLKK